MIPQTSQATYSRSPTDGLDGGSMPTALNPAEFAQRCREITHELSGHSAHRALDLLTNEVLSSLGYGEGIAIFERAVRRWHDEAMPYPARWQKSWTNPEIGRAQAMRRAGKTYRQIGRELERTAQSVRIRLQRAPTPRP